MAILSECRDTGKVYGYPVLRTSQLTLRGNGKP